VQAHAKKYVALLAVLLMLAAMFAYTMSDDEAIVPNPGGKDTIQQRMPAAP
jgi:hypothetical protein